jgi:antirestriction protein ArdC
VIAERLSVNAAVATRIHELAHALVDGDRQPEDPQVGYAEEELIAELIAYTCCRSTGLRTDHNSIPYLAAWAEQAELELLERTARLIHRLAARIEQALHGERDGGGGSGNDMALDAAEAAAVGGS